MNGHSSCRLVWRMTTALGMCWTVSVRGLLVRCFAVVLQDVVFRYLTSDSIKLNQIDAEDPEVSTRTYYGVSKKSCYRPGLSAVYLYVLSSSRSATTTCSQTRRCSRSRRSRVFRRRTRFPATSPASSTAPSSNSTTASSARRSSEAFSHAWLVQRYRRVIVECYNAIPMDGC